MTYRWLSNEEIIEFVNPVCRQRGWAELNVNEHQPTCIVKGAFDGVALVGFAVLQMFPVLGPFWADSMHRDGTVSRELAAQMHGYLTESKARGALTICETPVAQKLAERHGMTQVDWPVYMWVGGA